MRFRNLDASGDWTFGKGRNSYVMGNQALMLNVKTRLLSFLGDCFFDMEAGIDWWNLLGSKEVKQLVASIQRVILNSYGVNRIVDLQYNVTNRRFSIDVSLEFLDGTILTDTVEVLNA